MGGPIGQFPRRSRPTELAIGPERTRSECKIRNPLPGLNGTLESCVHLVAKSNVENREIPRSNPLWALFNGNTPWVLPLKITSSFQLLSANVRKFLDS